MRVLGVGVAEGRDVPKFCKISAFVDVDAVPRALGALPRPRRNFASASFSRMICEPDVTVMPALVYDLP